ncbi:F0F1 ATP synthase subunit epsilon [Sphingosinicella microcystinivorans]|uniref:ATP synthase epsilon chain n=1 Tax=Sphingosinicella microcystinivorans TaxID=335406 RepID=A0AAD1D5I8_SPHMI|nr:F0F1 ATP synthase subunit epsilon [Sphingosinicella microcystinivorans]RKS90940.1 ATP synthase F1 subcomplex epsilon subunit [Sphingosinicella microcystinivorans]BBE33859.1 ATP synthase epsilon chain [Sphingosinicella microcystinivorans]
MADNLHFELVSPERLLRSGDVHMVVVPGTEGDFGVLAGHAPFMSTIRPGAIEVYESASSPATRIFIDGGFAEVNDSGLTILAENAVPVAEIKADEVAKKLSDAREDVRLAKSDVERAVAEKQVARYEAMQAVAAN